MPTHPRLHPLSLSATTSLSGRISCTPPTSPTASSATLYTGSRALSITTFTPATENSSASSATMPAPSWMMRWSISTTRVHRHSTAGTNASAPASRIPAALKPAWLSRCSRSRQPGDSPRRWPLPEGKTLPGNIPHWRKPRRDRTLPLRKSSVNMTYSPCPMPSTPVPCLLPSGTKSGKGLIRTGCRGCHIHRSINISC